MVRVVVNPGICGFRTTIEVRKTAQQKVSVKISSECDNVYKLGKSLKEISIWDALKLITESEVYKQASKNSLHPACLVPVGILKAIEVEAGLALTRDAAIHFEISTHD